MAELPIDLQQLETVRGAWDILQYLLTADEHAADGDDIMDDLDLSSRSFDKAKRRLVTRGYIQMRSDYFYELTNKGISSAETLIEFGGVGSGADDDKIQRQGIIVVPRNLVIGQTSPLKIAIEPNDDFDGEADVVMRLSAVHADLGDFNEMVKLSSDAAIVETTITPQNYDQARLKLEVYQMSEDDLSNCGGMYVDVHVLAAGDTGEMIGYGTDLSFDIGD